MMEVDAFRALAAAAAAREAEVPAATARLAAAARAAGLPMASHDDDSVATRVRFRGLGAGICEFPMAEDVGVEARAAGEAVVMGCPNVVRGGSHLGWASAGGDGGARRVLRAGQRLLLPGHGPGRADPGRGALGLAARLAPGEHATGGGGQAA